MRIPTGARLARRSVRCHQIDTRAIPVRLTSVSTTTTVPGRRPRTYWPGSIRLKRLRDHTDAQPPIGDHPGHDGGTAQRTDGRSATRRRIGPGRRLVKLFVPGSPSNPPALRPNRVAATCRPRTSTLPPRLPVPALVKPARARQPTSRLPDTSDLLESHRNRDRIHGVKGRQGMRPSMCTVPRPGEHIMMVPFAGTRSCSANGAKTVGGPRSDPNFRERQTNPVHGEPNNRYCPIFRKKPDLVDQHPTSPNRTQPVSGCQRLGSCEPTRSTGISARHVESAMILAGSQRSA